MLSEKQKLWIEKVSDEMREKNVEALNKLREQLANKKII